jgi:hypothetical protein
MSLLTVVQDVCEVVGVAQPSTVFGAINADRTMQEMLRCANEMAQRISGDTREWAEMQAVGTFTGPGDAFTVPSDFRRMLLTSEIWKSVQTQYPMLYISDLNEWLQRRARNYMDSRGEWINYAGKVRFAPPLNAGETATYAYLTKNCILLNGGGVGSSFQSDDDQFLLDERLLKLGMISLWKQNKGSPYAEDMGTFSDALAMAFGSNKPSPTLINRLPIDTRFPSPSSNVGFSVALQGPVGPTGPAGPQGDAGSGGSGGGATVLVSDTPPTGAPDNTLWWESTTGVLYIRFNDGSSVQWVATLSAPGAAVIGGDMEEAPLDGQQYGRQSATWTTITGGSGGGAAPATVLPLMDGIAAIGITLKYAREDHVHPSDTTRATTAFVTTSIANIAGTVAPVMDGTATIGTVARYAHEDHIHPKSWQQITQAAYDALTPPNANMLYVIVG